MRQDAAVQRSTDLLSATTTQWNELLRRQSQRLEATWQHQWSAVEENAAALAQWFDENVPGTGLYIDEFPYLLSVQ